jgi:hypothetical protein
MEVSIAEIYEAKLNGLCGRECGSSDLGKIILRHGRASPKDENK